jgi:hypothetical protein
MGGNAHRKVQAERVLSSQFLRILEAPYACAAYGARDSNTIRFVFGIEYPTAQEATC